MKFVSAIVLCFALAGCASHGKFIDRGMFSDTPFVEGEGSSSAQAVANARKAIPKGYVEDNNWSKFGGCALPGEYSQFNEATQSYDICVSGRYRTALPLLPLDPKEQEEIQSHRKQKREAQVHYVGTGATFAEAEKDLQAKLPKDAVVDGWGIGCSVKNSRNPITKKGFCDPSIKGNHAEATAEVLKPNAARIFQ